MLTRFIKGKGKLLPSDDDTDAEELLEDQGRDDIEEEPEVVMVGNVEEGEEGDADDNVCG